MSTMILLVAGDVVAVEVGSPSVVTDGRKKPRKIETLWSLADKTRGFVKVDHPTGSWFYHDGWRRTVGGLPAVLVGEVWA